jgi:hypothetical protein
MDQVTLDIIRKKEDMLRAILQSKISKSVIGIQSKALGPGTYMTSVVQLIVNEADETTVVLKAYDMTGYFFDRSTLSLDEIEGVIPFTALFENPFLRDMEREIKNGSSYHLKLSR